MARPFEVRLPLERAYLREVSFAVELLDSVNLARVSQGVTVTAVGLAGQPIVNHGGVFVWLKENMANFQKLTIDPGVLPFARLEIPAAQLQRPLHTVELQPLANYPFTAGITALRGSLYETRVPLGTAPAPAAGASMRLEWLDDDGVTWRPGTAATVTNTAGDFITILRFAPAQTPRVDANGNLSVRLFGKRGALEKKQDDNLSQGRVTDRTYAWNELQ